MAKREAPPKRKSEPRGPIKLTKFDEELLKHAVEEKERLKRADDMLWSHVREDAPALDASDRHKILHNIFQFVHVQMAKDEPFPIEMEVLEREGGWRGRNWNTIFGSERYGINTWFQSMEPHLTSTDAETRHVASAWFQKELRHLLLSVLKEWNMEHNRFHLDYVDETFTVQLKDNEKESH